MKFHKKLSCGSRVIPCGTVDRQTPNTPNNENMSVVCGTAIAYEQMRGS